jgi:hypothetical protein
VPVSGGSYSDSGTASCHSGTPNISKKPPAQKPPGPITTPPGTPGPAGPPRQH